MFISAIAAFAASISWASAALVAHKPARKLGAFEFTRIQLLSSGAILATAATLTGAWDSVTWNHWPAFLVASLLGVFFGNLAMTACLRRGGPRRSQLLQAMVGPITAILAWLVLGEHLTLKTIIGGLIVVIGIVVAILFGKNRTAQDQMTGSIASVVAFGLASAFAQALGLIAMKPVLIAGTDPIAASAIRTGLAALAVTIVALSTGQARLRHQCEPSSVVSTVLAGVLGYVVAVSLLLTALQSGNTGVVATLGSLSPVIMLLIVWRMSHRPPWQAWAGAGLVAVGLGVMFINPA